MRRLIRVLITILVFVPILIHIAKTESLELDDIQTNSGILNTFEKLAYDTSLKITSPKSNDPEVVIIDIDEKALLKVGQWPWARDNIATLVDILFDHYEINVLGFDITFPEPDRSEDLELLSEIESKLTDLTHGIDFQALRKSRERDDILANSFIGRNVVLGFVMEYADRSPTGAVPTETFNYSQINQDLIFYELDTFTGNLPKLQQTASGAGNFNPVALDFDGKIRRVPMLVKYQDKIYDSLSLAVIKSSLGISEVEFLYDSAFEGSQQSLKALKVGPLSFPVSDYINMLVPYRGEDRTFKYISAADILERNADVSLLKDKIVLVGTTAAGLHDFRVTPLSENFPGVEVHANLISAILTGQTLESPDYQEGVQLVGLVILAFAITLFMMFSTVLVGSLITLAIIVCLWFGNIYLWRHGIVIPVTPLIVFTALTYFVHLIYGSFIESRSKLQLTKLFGQYVPPKLVEEMEADLTHYTMETKQAELTVMFADIKGFTTLSEALNAEQVAQLLNEFLTTMTEVIHNQRGTIDKYMGDSIMAFWGAPLDDEMHAQHAVLTAVHMQEKMQELNDKLTARDLPNIEICIGINTGNMSVGNMGSEFRMAYTVIGDSVNLAARLEGLTRIYDVSILLGENTRRALKNTLCLELDKVIVKGKADAVRIFEPIGLADSMTQEQAAMIQKHSQALLAYRNKNWVEAIRLFQELKDQYPEKTLFEMFLQRLEIFIEKPPQNDWDGVYTFTQK